MIDNKNDFLLIDHTADLGLEIKGSDPSDLFKKAGKALLQIMFGDISSDRTTFISVSLSGDDLPDLMVRWLTEILYLFEGEHLVAADIKIDSLSPVALDATIGITPFDPLQHELIREIKAVTYHQIEVTDKNGIWSARIILDI